MAKNKPAIILDIDGVLLDWFSTFVKWMKDIKGHRIGADASTSYAMTNMFPDLEEDAIYKEIAEFNNSHWFARLPHIPGAKDGVAHLRKAFPERVFAAVTSAGVNPIAVKRRCQNIEAFELDEIFIVPLGEPKEPYLRRYHASSVIFEDNTNHALKAVEIGQRAVLLNKSYNINDNAPGVIRMDGWESIEKAIEVLKAA